MQQKDCARTALLMWLWCHYYQGAVLPSLVKVPLTTVLKKHQVILREAKSWKRAVLNWHVHKNLAMLELKGSVHRSKDEGSIRTSILILLRHRIVQFLR